MCEVFVGQLKENYEPITRNEVKWPKYLIRLERSFWDIIDSMASAEGVSTPLFLSTLQSEVVAPRRSQEFHLSLRCACIKKFNFR